MEIADGVSQMFLTFALCVLIVFAVCIFAIYLARLAGTFFEGWG